MIIAAYNPKGGCGKTTTVVNVATALADSGRTVLVVDLEADLNASISLGVRPNDDRASAADLLLHHAQPSDAVRPIAGIANLHLIKGSPLFTDMDQALRNVKHPQRRLADVLRPLARQFDVVMLDSPSGYSMIPQSVLLAAEQMIVPIRAEYLALESLAQFFRWYRDHRTARKSLAQVGGILLTMVDYRRKATREIVDIIRVHNRHGVLRTEIPQDQRAGEAPSHGVPLVHYGRSRAGDAYRRLTTELLRRFTIPVE